MRIAHGSHAWIVSPTLYLYFHSDSSAPLASAPSSDWSRKRFLGCQTKRRNRAVTMTEMPPDTTAAGQTSIACFNVPPSILTNSATSQNGTSSETHGSWWPAMVDSVSSSSWLTAASVTIGVPIAPNATGAVLAMRLSTADWNGLKPSPTMIAPAIATGVPNPEVPSMIAPNENAMSKT